MMDNSIRQMLYSTVSESCDKHGNVIDAKEHDHTSEMILKMLEKMEFPLDENGELSLPQIHLGAELHDKLLKDYATRPANFDKALESLLETKKQEAIQREKERLERYKK